MLIDVARRLSRRDSAQPVVYGGVIAPGHRDKSERWVDRKPLPDGMFPIGVVAYRIDGNQVLVSDLRHRASRPKALVQRRKGIAAAVEERELRPQAVHEPEQAAAQSITAVVAPRDPPALLSAASTNAHVEVVMAALLGELRRAEAVG